MPPETPEFESNPQRALLQRLHSLGLSGVTSLPNPSELPPLEAPPQATAAAPPTALSPAAVKEDADMSKKARPEKPLPYSDDTYVAPEDRVEALAALNRKVVRCKKCPELVANRTQTVFGVGDPNARLVFFGEGPGADEDREGIPFIGRAGQLLDKMLEACTLERDKLYIMNVVKCRPPKNRAPETDESDNCRPFFEQQLDIIRPEFICCLGATAAKALLRIPPSQSLGSLRGKFHDYRGSQVLCTYHPAYLLRNPPAKKPTWEDLQLLMKTMGIKLPKKK